MNKRIEWIDNTKSFACFLVVLGHLLQSLFKITPKYLYNEIEFINYFIYLFHMPLFMCLSGYLYYTGKKINNVKDYGKFEFSKIINLLIPYIIFYSITIILKMVFTDSVNTPMGIIEWLGMFNNPIPPYWFLYALLAIFIITPILEKVCKDKRIVMIIYIILKVLSVFCTTKIYFIDSIMKYGIYFYLGAFINETALINKKINLIILSMVYFLLAIIMYNCISGSNIAPAIEIVMAIIGILVVINIFRNIGNSRVLGTYKKYTFQIFLMHTIFAAGMRMAMLKLGINNWYIHFIVGLIVSIYIPVLISIISYKIRFTNFFFFPLKTIEEYKKGKSLCQKKKN